MKKKHIGSDFDDFLRKEHLLEVSEATAAKRVIAFQIRQETPVSIWRRLKPKG
jgi:antitoxin HicB